MDEFEIDCLTSLRDCMLQISQGRITEKKKQIERLKMFLKSNSVLSALDRNSSKTQHNESYLTWAKVFTVVRNYINQEADRLYEKEQGSAAPSQIVLANRMKDKRQCSDLFKYIVKIINSRSRHGACLKIVNHLLAVLTNSFTLSSFGLDYTNVFLKEILPSPTMCLEISCDMFEKMIKLYCDLIKNPPPGWDKSVLTQVLYQLLVSAYKQYDVSVKPLFQFFKTIFLAVNYDKATTYHQYLLQSLLIMCQHEGSSCRVQLSSLGEATLLSFVHLWKSRPSESLKELILQFLLMEIVLHHPEGALMGDSRAFACDWTVWESVLVNIYYMVMWEMDDICQKNKYSSSKDYTLHPLFISVAVEICAQVFRSSLSTVHATQLCSTLESSNAVKRRRVEISFSHFTGVLHQVQGSLSSSAEIVAWLQLITALFTKYQQIVSLEEIVAVIESLMNIHLSCNQIEVKTWLLRCCQAALEAFCTVKQNSDNSGASVTCDWLQLWELCIKCVSLMHQCHESGHKLLWSLLKEKLISPKSEFLNLYHSSSSNKVSHSSLSTLVSYFENFVEPPPPSLQGLKLPRNLVSKDWFRNQLLDWLFCKREDMEVDDLVTQVGSADWKASTLELMAIIICSLCFQDYRDSLRKMLPLVKEPPTELSWIEELEKEVLYHTFDLPVIDLEASKPLCHGLEAGTMLQSVWDYIIQSFLEVYEKVSSSSSVMGSSTIFCMKFAYLMFCTLKTLYLSYSLTKEDLLASPLIPLMKDLIFKVYEVVMDEEFCSTEKSKLHMILPFIYAILSCPESVEYSVIKELGFHIITPEFFTVMLKKVGFNSSVMHQSDADFNRVSTSNGTQSRTFAACSPRPRKNRYDIMEKRNADEDELDIGGTEAENSNGSCDVQLNQVTDEFSKLQLECCDLLILMCKSGFAEKSLGMSTEEIAAKLLNVIPVKSIEIVRKNDVKLFLQLLKCVLLLKDLSAKDMNTVISAIKVLLNKCSKFRCLCAAIVSLFSDIYPHLFKLVDNHHQENKSHTIHLLHVLWLKVKENNCTKDVAFALTRSLCSLLKHDPKAQWNASASVEAMEVDTPPESLPDFVITDYSSLFLSPYSELRFFVAANMKEFYQCFQCVSDPLDWFTNTCQKYQGLISEVESEEVSEPERQDHLCNYVNTFMHFLFHGYLNITSYRKRLLFIMCELIKDEKVSVKQIIKLLKQIVNNLGYQTPSEVLESHVTYILDEWIEQNYSFSSFPMQLLELENLKHFFTSLNRKVIPIIMRRFDVGLLEIAAKELDLRVREVVYRSLPQLLAHAYVWNFVVDSNLATRFLHFIHQVMSKEAVSIFLMEHMDDIFICLLSLLEVTSSSLHLSEKGSSLRCSQGIVPQLFFEVVRALESEVHCDKSLIKFLCQKQDGLQNILLFIHVQLAKAVTSPDDNGQAVIMCEVFVKLLLPELSDGLPNYANFVISELINSLTSFIVKKNPLSRTADSLIICSSEKAASSHPLIICIDLILKICTAAMSKYAEIIGNVLSFLVSSLIPLASHGTLGEKVMALLTYLISDCSRCLESYIANLDPFPNVTHFQSLRKKHRMLMYKRGPYTLEMEMLHFIQSYGKTEKATVEGLKHLYAQLKSKKEDLLHMLTSMQDQCLFLEDIRSSTFHRLVRILLHLCVKGTSTKEIEIEASRCLGEIGPVDFSTILLPTAEENVNFPKELNQQNIFHTMCFNVLRLLYRTFKDERTRIKEISSRVLKDVFKTEVVKEFLGSFQYDSQSWIGYLYPFHSPKDSIMQNVPVAEVSIQKIDCVEIWAPSNDHHQWVTRLVCAILDSSVTQNEMFHKLKPLCIVNPCFCSDLLPCLIHAMINFPSQEIRDMISKHMSTFFEKFIEQIDEDHEPGEASLSQCFSKESLQTMLSVVNHLRFQDIPGIPSSSCSYCWTGLNLDYLHIAQAALHCSAYFTAILYTELWFNNVRTKASVISAECQSRSPVACRILSKAYTGIGDADGVYGSIEMSPNSGSIIDGYYLVEKKWDKLLNFYMSENKVSGVLKALKNCGLDHALQKYLDSLSVGVSEDSLEIAEYQSECAWRLGHWDVYIPQRESSGFQEQCYKSLQSLYNNNGIAFQKHVNASRFLVFSDLSHSSFESVRSILPMMSSLQMLVLMEDYSELRMENLDSFHRKWNEQNALPYADFEFLDPILWLHCMLLKQELDAHRGVATAKKYMTCLEKYSACARKENYLEATSRALHLLKSSCYGSAEDHMRWQIEEAKILWTKKDQTIANTILKSTLCDLEKKVNDDSCTTDLLLIYAEALSLMGKFLEETCCDNSAAILENYLEKSISVLQEAKNLDQNEFKLWDAHLAIARFADNQYQSILKYKSSASYQMKQDLMADAVTAISEMKAKKSKSTDEARALIIRERQHNIDVAELEELDKVQQDYLMRAVSNYLICFQGTNAHDLWIFRLTALWFQNLKNDAINTAIKNSMPKIETYKYVPLMYQLAARMGNQTNPQFADILFELIKKIALDHPHHSLPVIFSLTNSDPSEGNDTSQKKTNLSKKRTMAEESGKQERTRAAEKLLNDLQKTKLGPLLKDVSLLCNAYISLAYLSVEELIKAKLKVGKIPSAHPIMKIRNLERVPVLTETMKVDRSCDYDHITGIYSFEASFRLCGGVNIPKVIKCVGMDGMAREQLVKGRDDLRQDAVMQQVFCLVNNLLKENKETRKRKLHIRTYKVVPLSQRSGVIQWCEGTQPLSQYLIGPEPRGGAHLKYYPNCWSPFQCQKTMKSIADYSAMWKKRQIFDEICQNFPPVFRYFFFENFPEPSAWFERRQSYTKSVATSSIVGYILGLGDRHVNNILIDRNTAEFVHIDFGIAFEKGRILTTPETVPFRLTRDVVDGMGFNGVDGVFKRCCEKTMEVMRNSQGVLLTILEVLLHDPLYDWKSSPAVSSLSASRLEARSLSSESVEGVNRLAERALMRLQQKLQGLEEGMTLSISGHVNLLIQQARDPDNLCRLYAGWQPYL